MDEPGILLEAGPATIRRIGAPAPGGSDAVRALAALCALDDPVALVEGTPVPVDELLRAAIAAALHPPCGPVTVVHPGWWPRTRVERVVAAAAAVTKATAVPAALPRCAVIRRRYGPAAVVEIAAGVVAVSGHAGLRLLDGCDADSDAGAIAESAHGAPVLIDAPGALPGAAQRAEMIRKSLSDNRIRSQIVQCAPPPARECDRAPDAPRSRRWIPVAIVMAAAAVVTAAVGLRPDPERPAGPVMLADGRVVVEIPPHWTARRVTGGPGSRRIEVHSPDDTAVLHITSAYAPQSTLADAADVLGRAAAAEPAGVFTGLRAAVEFAGRPALGYREIRPGRVVGWWVVMDRSTRIAIGCQSAPGREESVRAACLAAVASAREAREGNRRGAHAVE